MDFYLYWLIPVYLGTWIVTRGLCRRASLLGLVHLPNNRSSHIEVTPHGGGLAMVLVATPFCLLFFYNLYGFISLLASFLAFVGLWDDIRSVPARIRFPLQVLVVLLLLMLLGKLPAIELLGMAFDGWFLKLVILVFGVWWINLFNFMDGIDAIASVQTLSILLLSIALMTIPSISRLESPLIQVMLITAAAVSGFLVLNWPPARIFMGDVGSTWLAFMILALALVSVKQGWLDYTAWLILTSVFVVDASITLFVRLLNGQKFYEAHRSHAYQKLSRRFQQRFIYRMTEQEARARAHRVVSLLVVMVNGFWLFPLTWVAMSYPQWGMGLVLLAWLPLCMIVLGLGAGRPDTA